MISNKRASTLNQAIGVFTRLARIKIQKAPNNSPKFDHQQ